MAKNKPEKLKKKKTTVVEFARTNYQISPDRRGFYQSLITGFTLFAIVTFAIFLRLEDFIDWQKQPFLFKHQGEYQMANFDSYYYLQFAKDLKYDNYNNIDSKRRVPNGVERPGIPPLLSIIALSINRLSGIPLSTVAIFIPVFLSSLLAIIVFLLGRSLSLNRIAALTAALFSIISITYVVRTRVGVFDTDSLNVVFALLNSYLFLKFALIKNQMRYWFFVLGLINTFLYFMWWNTATSVVILSAFMPLSAAILFFYHSKNSHIKYYFLALLAVVGLYFLSEQIISYLQLLFKQKHDVFPASDISELDAVSLSIFVSRTTNNVFVFMLMLVGMVYFIQTQKIKTLLVVMPVILGILPFFLGNRFILFSAPILALGMGYFVQLLFYFKDKITPTGVYVTTIFVVVLGIYSNYHTLTDKLAKPAVLENRALLTALNTYTPADANIWTNWDLGYQIRYFLDRGTFADGQFSGGELFYYLHFPLATDNLALSANFMRFYSEHGKQGMHKLYEIMDTEVAAFKFLEQVLSFNSEQTKKMLELKLQSKKLPTTANLATVDQWLSFLYPTPSKPLYLLLHQKMLQTVSWFKQGSVNLATGKMEGLPFFLSFYNLSEKQGRISNSDIKINKENGASIYATGVRNNFSSIRSYDGERSKITDYPNPAPLTNNLSPADNRFVFEWRKDLGYGAAISRELANTTFNKLFMRQSKSRYFQPIALQTPNYQIWKVSGDIYAN